ncbi:hypothetical protein LCGC14_2069080 [marine sediment metagenome]|uniref:Terminase large subunit gp17-like C-terminal domain-containing protein n=1 Tax=marine sediment metagenome TaxID=412755 RepID=A0A0F9EIU1_9ZZZZ
MFDSVQVPVDPIEAVKLGAVDSTFYGHYFFPEVTRQASPDYHVGVWDLFENPLNRYANVEIFRGGAKTTLARLFMSKRIAYGISHTILFLGKSEGHAARSIEWVMQQVEYNTLWAETFGLRKGKKWTATDCEIYHGTDSYPIRILALGITGSVRGIIVGAYRPDLIIVDDPCDEENTATPEQRDKTTGLFFSAIKESLVPASEDPTAMLALLQTPLDAEDLSAVCTESPEFASMRVGILTDENEEAAESAWPERWTKETILEEKMAAIARNQLSIWTREKMCLIISRETSSFLEEWLEFFTVLPPNARYVMAIDPTPILSDKARMTGQKTDLQAVMVKAYWKMKQYIVEYATNRDEDPDQLVMNMDRLCRKYPILRCGVEGVAYQRNLKWFIERQMKRGRLKTMHVMELGPEMIPGAKSKYDRIVQAHTGVASQGLLFVRPEMTEFISQFNTFPNCKYKDLLDVSAMCDATISSRQEGYLSTMDFDEEDIEELKWERAAP